MKNFIKLIELFPAIAFFVTYKITDDLITATATIIVSCLGVIALEYILVKKISKMQIFLAIFILIFGLPTILLKDPAIIKWKITFVNIALASLLLFFQYALKKNPLLYLMGSEINLPDFIWRKIGLYFSVFFIFAAALNTIIAFYLPDLIGIDAKFAESLWVDYKTFGNSILNIIFIVICFLYLIKKYPEAFSSLKKDV